MGMTSEAEGPRSNNCPAKPLRASIHGISRIVTTNDSHDQCKGNPQSTPISGTPELRDSGLYLAHPQSILMYHILFSSSHCSCSIYSSRVVGDPQSVL